MPALRDQIEQAYRAMEQAFFAGDADALTAIYSDDAQWFMPGAPAISGRDAITQAWKRVLAPGNTLRVEVRELQDAGDWAYELGAFTASDSTGKLQNSGKYLVIWKRQENGSWKTHRDLFHWDVP